MLRFFARFIAAVSAALFVLATIAVVIFHAAATRIGRAQIYKDALVREQFYDRLPDLMADLVKHSRVAKSVSADESSQAGDAFLRKLTSADWRTLSGAIAPSAYLRQQFESGLDQCDGFLHSTVATPTVRISLADLKRRLAGPEATDAYLKVLASKPPGTAQQLQAAGGLPVDFRPPDEYLPQIREKVRQLTEQLAGQIPDTVDLLNLAPASAGTVQTIDALKKARATVQRMETWAAWSPAVPAVLLVLVTLFGVRSLRGCLLWWGIPCLCAGLGAAAMAFPVVPLTRSLLSSYLLPSLTENVPAATVEALVGLTTAAMQEIMSAALTTAAALAVVGLLAVIAARFCPRPAAPAAQAFRSAS